MNFMILCFDKPNVGELRQKTRVTHLEYLKEHGRILHMGGPFENDQGGIVGTFFLINVADRAAAEAFTDNEPFHKAGVFESVLVRRWRQMQPEIEPGANASTAHEATLKMKEEGREV